MKTILSTLLLLLCVACGSSHENAPNGLLGGDENGSQNANQGDNQNGSQNGNQSGSQNNGSTQLPNQVLTAQGFQQIKDNVLTPYCIGCHTGRHAAYENYTVVKASSQRILARVFPTNPSRRMPPLSEQALPDNLKQQLRAWIEAGAPEVVVNTPVDNGDGGTVDNPLDNPSTVPGEDGVRYSFLDVRERVFRPNNCMKCHSQYEDFEPVKADAGSILSTVLSDRMPYPRGKGGTAHPASKAQKEILMNWVAQGAPEFVGETASLEPSPLEPNWISLRNKVLGPKCILCHNTFSKRAPKSMETYERLLEWSQESPELFSFTNPTDSHFVGAILGRVDDDEFFFDPMPFNSPVDDVSDLPSVKEDELEVIKEWIALGLPER